MPCAALGAQLGEESCFAIAVAVLFWVEFGPGLRFRTHTPMRSTQYVNAEMARQHIPGVALLVARHGEILRAEGFGFANVEPGRFR